MNSRNLFLELKKNEPKISLDAFCLCFNFEMIRAHRIQILMLSMLSVCACATIVPTAQH